MSFGYKGQQTKKGRGGEKGSLLPKERRRTSRKKKREELGRRGGLPFVIKEEGNRLAKDGNLKRK